ncbi:Outer envelope pore protein 21B [Citrus sinensis]|uniref:Outer envelope pore protein 21B n=1 Tax=Citrus sinensis TaxID=2711 RepID=A0ACB8KZ15_CITSI|nr:Outer envelope pore protein 21B [Citrus sinensis]
METSLRYGKDSKALRIYAKEKIPIDSNTRLQIELMITVHGELDTRVGAPSYVSAMIRHFYPDLSASFGLGVQYDKHEKLRYTVRGKKVFPVTSTGLLSFNIKGRCEVDKEFKQKDQDVRFKLGYEVVDKVPYMQIRENNWTVNADANATELRLVNGTVLSQVCYAVGNGLLEFQTCILQRVEHLGIYVFSCLMDLGDPLAIHHWPWVVHAFPLSAMIASYIGIRPL